MTWVFSYFSKKGTKVLCESKLKELIQYDLDKITSVAVPIKPVPEKQTAAAANMIQVDHEKDLLKADIQQLQEELFERNNLITQLESEKNKTQPSQISERGKFS